MPLTDIQVKNARPAAKPYKLADGKGLFMLIQPSGGKWWRFKYRIAGKEKQLSFGVYPDVSISEARNRLMDARKALQEGKDPSFLRQEEKRRVAVKYENTFEIIARQCHENRKTAWNKKYAHQIKIRLEADVFPKIGSRPLVDISTPDLLAIARTVEQRGAHELAHRTMQYCSQVFSYAVQSGLADRNPAQDIRGALKPVVKKHHAYLKADELPEYMHKLENDEHCDTQTKTALRLMLLTFVRTTELRGAEWTEIDLDKSEWRIPASRMKMKDPHIVPLSKQAVMLLREMKLLTGKWKYVFPHEFKPAFGYMSENTMLYAIYRMGYRRRATVHGFRATASTILNEEGFRTDIIERQLAHAERNKVRASYNHAQYLKERREMMQWWADYLDRVSAGKKLSGKLRRTV
jgi:integrase